MLQDYDLWNCCYAILAMVRSIAMSMYVCMYVYMSVCLSVCPLVCLKTTSPNFTKFPIHVTCGRGSVLLWRRCDVMYFRFCGWGHASHNGPCGQNQSDDVMFEWLRQVAAPVLAVTCAPGTKCDITNRLEMRQCYVIKIRNYTRRILW